MNTWRWKNKTHQTTFHFITEIRNTHRHLFIWIITIILLTSNYEFNRKFSLHGEKKCVPMHYIIMRIYCVLYIHEYSVHALTENLNLKWDGETFYYTNSYLPVAWHVCLHNTLFLRTINLMSLQLLFFFRQPIENFQFKIALRTRQIFS